MNNKAQQIAKNTQPKCNLLFETLDASKKCNLLFET